LHGGRELSQEFVDLHGRAVSAAKEDDLVRLGQGRSDLGGNLN
jgi:hypothetical protein